MDHAATTPLDKMVLDAMRPFFDKKYGNASSLHDFGQEAHAALEESRETMARHLNCDTNEIIFTSGGTEADNMAIKGVAFAKKKGHIITSRIEHHAVLHTCQWLEKHGFEVTYLPVDRYGFVSTEDFESAIRKGTILATIMHANNEIGTIEPIEEMAKICNEHDVLFHTDAVQTFGKLPINTKYIDMLSISGHKLHGPKGIGALMLKRGIKIEPLLHGGGHESGKRSGTENVPGAVGLAKATELAYREMKSESKRLSQLRDRMIKGLLKIEGSNLNGHPAKRLPNNINVWFRFVEGESLILRLNDKGIAASTGSACTSKSLEPSHVLLAIGLKHEEAHGSLRLTLGKQNTLPEVNYVTKTVPTIVRELREISPFKRSYKV